MPRLKNSRDEFQLEPPVEPGNVPTGVIDELRVLRTAANDASTDFREAIKVQADKHKIKPAALRKYVVALGRDKVDEARAEAADLERLIDSSPAISVAGVVVKARGDGVQQQEPADADA